MITRRGPRGRQPSVALGKIGLAARSIPRLTHSPTILQLSWAVADVRHGRVITLRSCGVGTASVFGLPNIRGWQTTAPMPRRHGSDFLPRLFPTPWNARSYPL